jgi:hypothetical protein
MREQRDNSGTLGKNERREKDTHPEYTGKCVIDGKEHWISAWVKQGPAGKFFSLAFKPKEARQQQAAPAPASDDWSDDIPF